jgi:hypothetical protein
MMYVEVFANFSEKNAVSLDFKAGGICSKHLVSKH